MACNPIFLTPVSNPGPILWVSAVQSISISRPDSHASPQKTSPDIPTARRNWTPQCLTVFLTGQDHYWLSPGPRSGQGWSTWSHHLVLNAHLWPYFPFRWLHCFPKWLQYHRLSCHHISAPRQKTKTQFRKQSGSLSNIWIWMLKFCRQTWTQKNANHHQRD